jgi:DNA-directed RNA polymerase subunit RPC12/RpoP
VSERTMRCGNCGADVTFSSPGALVVVCTHCHWASYRTDVDLETIGEVAQPALLASHFQVGTAGELHGVAFTVRGQLQLDHGAGLWNEWAAEDAEGEWFWIAEAQGELLVFREVETPESLNDLDQEELSPGKRVKLHGQKWVVNEVGEGQVVAAAGEHPIRIDVGERTSYVDLQADALGVATLDFTREGAPECLVGERVQVEDLALDPLTQPEHGPAAVTSKRIDCAECGGAIELHDPEHAVRVGCPACGTLLEPGSDKVRAIGEAQEIKTRPDIPLGTHGELGGEAVQVLGFMERRVKADGRWWPWREYLLRTPAGAYRWLVEDSGHWLYVTPVPYAVARTGSYEGQKFKDFTSGTAEVHWVIGEFYWEVRAGDEVKARDYTAPPRSLSIESTPLEISASVGVYVEPEDLANAFDGPVDLPRRHGVGMAQVNTIRPGADWKLYALLVVLLICMRIYFGGSHENRVVHAQQYGPTPTEQDKMSDGQFSDDFELTADPGNLKLRIDLPGLEQGWVGVSGALVNLDTGKVVTFDTSAQRYSGISGGEKWTEGNRRGSAMLGSIPAGKYRLRLASMGYEAGCGKHYQVMVTSQVPGTMWLLFAILLPLAIPAIATVRWMTFESKRWKNSDHPWGED